MGFNKAKVPQKNDSNLRNALTAKEKRSLDAAIKAGGKKLIDFLEAMRKTSLGTLLMKRNEIRSTRDPVARKTLQAEARGLIFKKVGAQAYLKAIE